MNNYDSQIISQGGMQQSGSMYQVLPDQRNSLYVKNIEAEYQREIRLIHERASVDTQKYAWKRSIDEESIARVMKVKADIQRKSELLLEEIIITDDGRLRRKQEFMAEDSKIYHLANFTICGQPIKFRTYDSNHEVLNLHVIIEGREDQLLFFDLKREDSSYFRRKFRNAGIIFKKKRRERDDFFFDVMDAIVDRAVIMGLPRKYGFYISDGSLKYADKKSVLWKEVLEYAK